MKVVFIVIGYDEYVKTTGNYFGSVQVEVYAKTEAEAIAKAKKYIKKEGYRVSQIIEIDPELKK